MTRSDSNVSVIPIATATANVDDVSRPEVPHATVGSDELIDTVDSTILAILPAFLYGEKYAIPL